MFGSSIAALFERGEPEFRARERLALTSLVAEPGFSGSGAVVATGGGTVGDPSNLAAIQAVGISVYLRVEIATLVDRLTREDERARRPLLVGDGVGDVDLAARLTELLALREPAYARASATVDGGAEVAVIVAEITEAITRSQ